MPFVTRTAIAFAVLLVLTLPVSANPDAKPVFERIAERLSLMKSVAAWKRARSVAVEDLAREAVVLEKATRGAEKHGLAADTTRPFFEAQILAAKDIQNCWIGRWNKDEASVPDSVPDLKTEIRPKLITVGAALVAEVTSALNAGVEFGEDKTADFDRIVVLDCLSPETRGRIYRKLGAIRLAR